MKNISRLDKDTLWLLMDLKKAYDVIELYAMWPMMGVFRVGRNYWVDSSAEFLCRYRIVCLTMSECECVISC